MYFYDNYCLLHYIQTWPKVANAFRLLWNVMWQDTHIIYLPVYSLRKYANNACRHQQVLMKTYLDVRRTMFRCNKNIKWKMKNLFFLQFFIICAIYETIAKLFVSISFEIYAVSMFYTSLKSKCTIWIH